MNNEFFLKQNNRQFNLFERNKLQEEYLKHKAKVRELYKKLPRPEHTYIKVYEWARDLKDETQKGKYNEK